MGKICMLGDVAILRSGRSCQSIPFSGVRNIRISDVKPYNILGDDFVSPSHTDNKLENGDILLPRTGKYTRPYLYQTIDGPACFASFFYKVSAVSVGRKADQGADNFGRSVGGTSAIIFKA